MNHLFSAARRMLIPVLLTALLVTGAKTPGGGFFLPEVLPAAAAAEPEAGPVLNILLIGRDDRKDAECARSDAMILCSFRKDSRKLTMTSFLRDLYVPIPGHGKNRLNAAYAFGGSKLLKKTLEQNFGVPIDGCVEVDFSCFPEIIDILGGVTIDLREDEARFISRETGARLSKGPQKLTGRQALVYTRIRKLDADGDFGRTRRQRKVLIALMDSYRDAGLIKGLSMVRTLMPYVSTDMSRETLLAHAKTMMPALSGMRLSGQTIPAPDTFVYRNIDGMEVILADLKAAGRLLSDAVGSGK